MRLTMKALIRWEQINKKPFSLLDYSNEDEIVSLFYVCDQSGKITKSLIEFKESLTQPEVKKMISDFERQTSLLSQFQAPSESKGQSEESIPIYIKKVIPMLIMDGLDVSFALNDMELCDLPIFLQAYDQKVRDKLTAQRLWAFLQLSPHLAKGTTPKDVHPFAWEIEEELTEEDLKEGRSEFEAFMKAGLKK